MKQKITPWWVFKIWSNARSFVHCADDLDLPMHLIRRRWWKVRGEVQSWLFSWWRMKRVK